MFRLMCSIHFSTQDFGLSSAKQLKYDSRSKASRHGKWHDLASTNTELYFEQAYKIYATRWSIEGFFKECKQYLGLGKCQSQDFDAQMASIALCMLRSNILAAVMDRIWISTKSGYAQ